MPLLKQPPKFQKDWTRESNSMDPQRSCPHPPLFSVEWKNSKTAGTDVKPESLYSRNWRGGGIFCSASATVAMPAQQIQTREGSKPSIASACTGCQAVTVQCTSAQQNRVPSLKHFFPPPLKTMEYGGTSFWRSVHVLVQLHWKFGASTSKKYPPPIPLDRFSIDPWV